MHLFCEHQSPKWRIFYILTFVACIGYANSQSSISLSSVEILLPCVYRGIPYLHGENWKVDGCTTCRCDNATVTCRIESCQPAFCPEPYKPEGECCFLCPSDIEVKSVAPELLGQDISRNLVTLYLQVVVKINNVIHTRVRGEGLWGLSAWLSSKNDSENRRSSERLRFSEQILDEQQSSESFPARLTDKIFENVIYQFNTSSPNCSEETICVEFGKGGDAQPFRQARFTLRGYPNDTTLIGCTSAYICPNASSEEARSVWQHCEVSGNRREHSETWRTDGCTECFCNNGTTRCYATEECPPLQCINPEKPEGSCCHICPYHIRVRHVSPLVEQTGILTGHEGLHVFHLRVPIKFHESNHTTGVEGANLWKLSAWVSLPEAKDERYDYKEQILNEDQMSQTYRKGEEFVFENLGITTTHPTGNCGGSFSICVKLDKNSNAKTKQNISFVFSGLPDEASLSGCTKPISIPKRWCGNVEHNDTCNMSIVNTSNSCEFESITHLNGEQWKVNDCTTCTCKERVAACVKEFCVPVSCASPMKTFGECCLSCPEDEGTPTNGSRIPCILAIVIVIVIAIFIVVGLSVFVFHRKKTLKTSTFSFVHLEKQND